MGNTLRWQTEYLGRQLPVLEARDGFPRKVKPLVRLSERETAAYCLMPKSSSEGRETLPASR